MTLKPGLESLSKIVRLPRNAKEHDLGILHTSYDAYNFLDRLIINTVTGHLVAGHGRIDALQQRKASGELPPGGIEVNGSEWLVPVDYVEIPEDKEEAAAIMLNRSNEAGWDEPLLAQMLADLAAQDMLELTGFNGDDLDALLVDLEQDTRLLEEGKPDLSRADVPDALWPSDNEWGIPTLRADLQAKAVDLPVSLWGAVARTARMKGTWLFYCEDYRFEALWKDPSGVVNSACASIVEPNFSIGPQTPRAVALWQIYRKRWLARYWQSLGIRVFVDMNVDTTTFGDIMMLGVPAGWLAYATRGYSDRLEFTVAEYDLACERAGTDGILFLLYGGGRACGELARERGWAWISEHMDQKRGGVVKDG